MEIIGYAASVASLVCFIIIVIKQFQTAGALHGIIGIVTCGLWTFIWGWMNVAKTKQNTVMLIWTVSIIASLATTMMTVMNAAPA